MNKKILIGLGLVLVGIWVVNNWLSSDEDGLDYDNVDGEPTNI